MRPRAVRTRKPCWIRYGSTTSSSVPRSSDKAAASDSHTDRTAVEVIDDGAQQAPVQIVETFGIDGQHVHGRTRGIGR